jgi:hypothetical protein
MLTPDYQEFTNPAHAGSPYNTVICGVEPGKAVEIIAALRDCHGCRSGTKPELSGKSSASPARRRPNRPLDEV